MRRFMRTRSLLLLLVLASHFVLGMTAGGSNREQHTFNATHADLVSVLYSGERLKRPGEVDHVALTATIPGVEAIIEAHGVWAKRPQPQRAELERHVWSDLSTGYMYASFTAATRESAKRWALRAQGLHLRLLEDPRSRELWEIRGAASQPRELRMLFRVVADLPSLRQHLVDKGYLEAEDWAVLSGITWVAQQGTVLSKEGTIFVEQGALQLAGVPIRVSGLVATAADGSRRVSVPIGAPSDAGPRRGFRTADGKVYIPVEEIDRQGLYAVQVRKKAQMVEIGQEPPQRAR